MDLLSNDCACWAPPQFTTGASAFSTSSIRIRCKDFTFLSFNFVSDQHCRDAFESIMKLTCVNSVTKLYAFMYKPGSLERKQPNGWRLYDPAKEYERMGCFEGERPAWRVTKINEDHTFSPTYPSYIVVPAAISDTVLNYGAKYRSKSRFPALSYYHRFNKGSITRCSQPMVGLKQNRSVQDEKMVSAIFCSTQTPGVIGASSQENLIVDARPTTNAMAQTALGAGTENMENYKGAKKVYLGIDNIHVMRESLNKVVEALRDGDISSLPPNREILHKSNWLKYLSIILDGAVLIARQVHFNFANVMIHCSDRWDRTAQLSGLAQNIPWSIFPVRLMALSYWWKRSGLRLATALPSGQDTSIVKNTLCSVVAVTTTRACQMCSVTSATA